MPSIIDSDWRYKDQNLQKRQFLLSSFVRMKIPLSRNVYEFCDLAISQGYQFDLGSLSIVDVEVRKLYDEFVQRVS